MSLCRTRAPFTQYCEKAGALLDSGGTLNRARQWAEQSGRDTNSTSSSPRWRWFRGFAAHHRPMGVSVRDPSSRSKTTSDKDFGRRIGREAQSAQDATSSRACTRLRHVASAGKQGGPQKINFVFFLQPRLHASLVAHNLPKTCSPLQATAAAPARPKSGTLGDHYCFPCSSVATGAALP